MSTQRKIADWTFERPDRDAFKATVFISSPQSNSEHEDPFTFHAEVAGKQVGGSYENINDLHRFLQVQANPMANLDWIPVYLVGIRRMDGPDKAERHGEGGRWDRRNATTSSLSIAYRAAWMALQGKKRYFCDRNPADSMRLADCEISDTCEFSDSYAYAESEIQIYPGTDATRAALDDLIAKLQRLGRDLAALNHSEDLTRLSSLLLLPPS